MKDVITLWGRKYSLTCGLKDLSLKNYLDSHYNQTRSRCPSLSLHYCLLSLTAYLLHGYNNNFVRRLPADWVWCTSSAWRYLIYLQIPRTSKSFPSRSSSKVVTKEVAGRCAKWWGKDRWVLAAVTFRAHCWVYHDRSRHGCGAMERQWNPGLKLEVCPNTKRATLE